MLRRCTMCNLFKQQTRSILSFNTQYMCFSNNQKDLFECDQKILEIINNNNQDLVHKYNIPESINNALKLYREKHGPFTSLNNLLQVEGMDKSILNQVLYSFVKNEKYTIKEKYKSSTFIPAVKNVEYQTNSTILSIYVATNIVAWTLLEISENVLEWNYESYANIPDNSNSVHLLTLAQNIHSKLPKCDIYIIDETSYDQYLSKSVKNTLAYIKKQQLKGILLGILLKENSFAEDDQFMSKVYFAQHNRIATLFDLRVGSEIMSSHLLTERLLHTDNESEKNPIGLYISNEIMDIYKSHKVYIQDQMNWSLLTALVFLQFALLKKYNYSLQN